MGTLKIRNCSKWRLKYWRVIAFHKTNYVAAGQEGTYNWGATYTLKVERDEDGKGTNSRAAVNQSGTYYAYWSNGKVNIYSEEQFQSCLPNDDNPFVGSWGHPVKVQKFPISWTLMESHQVAAHAPTQEVEWTKEMGFRNTESTIVRVTETVNTEVTIGMGFEVKGVAITGTARTGTSSEHFEEHMEEKEVYEKITKVVKFTIEPEHSLAIWQATANLWGHMINLKHFAYLSVGDRAPDDPVFDDLCMSYQEFN